MQRLSPRLPEGLKTLPLFLLLVLISFLPLPAHSEARVPCYGLFELSFNLRSPLPSNPFTEVRVETIFTNPQGRRVKQEGFYDGGQTWKVRIMPSVPGQWRWETRSSPPLPGLEGTGSFRCVPSHLPGPLQVYSKNPLWFQTARGKPIYLKAFHLWNLDIMPPSVLRKTLQFLKRWGFNTIVGPHLTPQRLLFERNPQGNPDFSRFSLPSWRRLDQAIQILAQEGFYLIPFSILGGTNGLPKISGPRDLDLFLRYWVSRWNGYWNITYQPTSEWEEGYSEEEILQIGARLSQLDQGQHLISVHSLKASSERVQKVSWYGYHTIQDKLSENNPSKYQWFASLHQQVPKPILAHECLWEGNYYQREAGLDVENLRKGAWAIAFSGGQINYADEVVPPRQYQRLGDEGKTFSDRGMELTPQGLLYPYLQRLFRWMESLPFWEYTLQPRRASTGFCLAKKNQRWLIYTPTEKPFTLHLEDLPGDFTGKWVDPHQPLTPVRDLSPLSIKGGQNLTLTPPREGDWILILERRS